MSYAERFKKRRDSERQITYYKPMIVLRLRILAIGFPSTVRMEVSAAPINPGSRLTTTVAVADSGGRGTDPIICAEATGAYEVVPGSFVVAQPASVNRKRTAVKLVRLDRTVVIRRTFQEAPR